MKRPIAQISPGNTILYHNTPCIVLHHYQDCVLLMCLNPIQQAFGSSNDLSDSNLLRHLNSVFLHNITGENPDEITSRIIDLTAANGSDEYKICDAKIAPLTLNEYQKYHDIIPRLNQKEWLATPSGTAKSNQNSNWILGTNSNGSIVNLDCTDEYSVRPAFLIMPDTMVDDMTDTENKDSDNLLDKYSTNELIAEINRRMNP